MAPSDDRFATDLDERTRCCGRWRGASRRARFVGTAKNSSALGAGRRARARGRVCGSEVQINENRYTVHKWRRCLLGPALAERGRDRRHASGAVPRCVIDGLFYALEQEVLADGYGRCK